MSDGVQEQRRRYVAMIEAALPPIEPFLCESEGPGAVQVERGLVFPLCLRDPQGGARAGAFVDRLIELAPEGARPMPEVVDRQGHRRPAYRGLLIYAWLHAQRIVSQSPGPVGPPGPERVGGWERAIGAWCGKLEADAAGLTWSPDGIPAAAGAGAAAACWAGLSLYLAGKTFLRDAWTDRAIDVFAKVAAGQQPSGALLAAGPADNPETLWYHELVMLHAAASYATQAGDRAVGEAVVRAAEYHLAETQPDHATSQPWGLFAFASNIRTHSLADQVLHGTAVQGAQAGRGDGVSFVLLADALYCLSMVAGH